MNTIPTSIPAHLLAVLAGQVQARAIRALVPPQDKRPVFPSDALYTGTTGQQGASPRRSLSSIIEDAGDLQTHDAPRMHDNCDPDLYALTMGDAL